VADSGVESLADEPRLRWSQWQSEGTTSCRFATPGTDPATRNSPAASPYKVVSEQMAETQTALGRLVPEALASLSNADRHCNCCGTAGTSSRTHPHGDANEFCWASQELAIRVQALKTISLGLQDLAAAAEQLELVQRRKKNQ